MSQDDHLVEPVPFWVDFLERKRKYQSQDSQKSKLFRLIQRDVRFLMILHGWRSYTLLLDDDRVMLFYSRETTLRYIAIPLSVFFRKCNIRITLEEAVQANVHLHGN